MFSRLFCRPVLAAIVLLSSGAGLWAQGQEYIRANYTKYEYLVPMRDGVKLFTSVYIPKDDSKTYPVMLSRTPYTVSPYGVDKYKDNLGPSEKFARDGYIFVYQDVRGRNASEGTFVNMTPHRPAKGPKDTDESTDTYDTIDWIVKTLPHNNGRVGQWGISYPGFYTAAGMIDAHPALKAASPQAPIADWWVNDDFHHNGVVFLPHAFRFLATFGKARPEPVIPEPGQPFQFKTNDHYDFYLRMGPLAMADEKYFKGQIAFWNEMLQHPDYDEFWKARNLRPHLKGIKPAVLTVGGWFDAEDLFGALKVYESVEKNSPGADNKIVMGPWVHGGWARGNGDRLGSVAFGQATSPFYRDNIEFPFFQQHLKGKSDAKLPEAYMFETGTNVWRQFDRWPPAAVQEKRLYLQPNGKLTFQVPEAKDAFDEYVSDPNKPVPFMSYVAPNMPQDYMVDDQRHASRRPDVLTYESDVLDEDLTIAGPITPSLFVSTTGTDSDWVVKLIDVYPNDYPAPKENPRNVEMGGYQQLVRGEPFRGKYRNDPAKPEPFVPGKVTKVEFVMPDMLHTFRKGHKIMVQIQSSWFPLTDRNPQQFLDINKAKAADFIKATQRVYRGGASASHLRVQVLPQPRP